MIKWSNDQMIKWSNDQIIKWSNDHMIKWSNDQMIKTQMRTINENDKWSTSMIRYKKIQNWNFSRVQTPQTSDFSSFFHDFADSEGSGHEKNFNFGIFCIWSSRLIIYRSKMGSFVFSSSLVRSQWGKI